MADIKREVDEAVAATPGSVQESIITLARATKDIGTKVSNLSKELGEKIGEVKSYVDQRLEKHEQQDQEDKRLIVDRLESWEKRSIAAGYLTLATGSDQPLLDAIPQKARRHIDRVRAGAYDGIKRSVDDAIKEVAVAEWFRLSARAQLSQFMASRERDLEQLRALEKAFAAVQKASYNEGTPAQGGYAVPDIVLNELMRLVFDSNVVASRLRPVEMASDTVNIPNEASQFSVYWASEAGTLTQGESTLGQSQLVAKKIYGYGKASSEVLEDAAFDLLAYVREVIAEQIGYELDQEILEGDGTNLTGLNATSGVNTVDAGGSTATNGAAVRFQDLALALYKAQHASTRNNAAWFMHPDIAATIVGMVDSNNQPVFHFGGADRTPTEMILGRPLYTVPALSRTQTKGTSTDCSTIYFGPWRKGLFGIRRQLTFEVTNQASFTTDEVDFRMIGRFDCAFPVPSAFTKITGCRVV